jgi:hypothetical protein
LSRHGHLQRHRRRRRRHQCSSPQRPRLQPQWRQPPPRCRRSWRSFRTGNASWRQVQSGASWSGSGCRRHWRLWIRSGRQCSGRRQASVRGQPLARRGACQGVCMHVLVESMHRA